MNQPVAYLDDRLDGIEERAEDYDFSSCPTRTNRDGPYHKPDVAAAIYKTQGNFAHMGVLLGRRRHAVRSYVLAHPELVEMMEEVRESTLDYVESHVLSQAANGDAQQARFVLQTLGKDRGYTTRAEQTGANGGPIDLRAARIDVDKLDTETIKKILDATSASGYSGQ